MTLYLKKINRLDQEIVLNVQGWRKPFLNKLLTLITYTGTGRAWFTFALVVNVLNLMNIHLIQNQNQFLRAMLCPLLAWLLGLIVKRLIARDRPSEAMPGYMRVIESPTCGSFPSTHAASAFAFYTALQLYAHPWSPFVGVWAVLVSFSRLYLGVHFLTDILGGAVFGAVIAFFQKTSL